MKKDFDYLRQSLIDEALNSPMLLSDLAGLESYVAESYNCRSFIELLQNADDAGASCFYVKRHGDYLIVANNGRFFNLTDLESLCRSASSKKVRGSSIGYRGIGFKSVVSFAKEIHLISGEFEVTFSKTLSKILVPEAPRVPLIRIPHPIENTVKDNLHKEFHKLQEEGFKTIFVFSGVIANQIKEEYTDFAQTTLLFLNNIQRIVIDLDEVRTASIIVSGGNEFGKIVKISTPEEMSDWLICSYKKCNIGFSIENNEVSRLPNHKALIHAFLPTEDSCGLGVIVNGDFSTDPSRRHLIFDEITKDVIAELSEFYCKLLKDAIEKNNVGMVDALIPSFDLKLVQLMKQSFAKEFAIQIKVSSGDSFSKLYLAPEWINAVDYYRINPHSIKAECAELQGIVRVLKYLGSKSDSISNIIACIDKTEISLSGYAQVAVEAMKNILMNRKLDKLISAHLFMSENHLRSLKEIESDRKIIDDSYIQLLIDKGLQEKEMVLCFKKMGLIELQHRQFIKKEDVHLEEMKDSNEKSNASNDYGDVTNVIEWFNNMSIPSSVVIRNNSEIKRWRSAEDNARKALNANGFKLTDVSSLNMGYDLEGLDPNGNTIFIEVKSIGYPGQKFRMTNNEFAAAQYKQDSYYIAIVKQEDDMLEISFIKNPVKCLQMNRQCVQWIWECTEYDYFPMRFSI